MRICKNIYVLPAHENSGVVNIHKCHSYFRDKIEDAHKLSHAYTTEA